MLSLWRDFNATDIMDKINKTEEGLKYCYKYPHPSVTTDCVIFGFDGTKLRVLLVQRGIEPYKGRWAFPGGFMKMDESAEEGALRELQEETGLKGAYIRQFHTFTAPQRDPRERVITIAYYALVKMQEVKGGDDAADARWFALDEVPQLAFDHDQILRKAEQHCASRFILNPWALNCCQKSSPSRNCRTSMRRYWMSASTGATSITR